MAGLDPFSMLCPDGRLIPTGNGGVFFHPHPMSTPVDLVGLVHAMNAPREAGPAFHMSHEGLRDVGALETAQRVVHDLIGRLGAGARITTIPVDGTERTAVSDWQKAADMVGVPVGVAYRPWMEPSARVVRVGTEGRPDPAGEFARVLPKGLAAMRAALDTARTLAADTGTAPWDRLQALVSGIDAHRSELRMPSSARLPGASLWQAGFQLAAGMALGLPGPDGDLTAVTPVSVAELARLWGDPELLPGTEALTAAPGTVLVVHHEPRVGDGEVRLLVSHDGALWWVDLAAPADRAVTRFDPENPAHAGALTALGTTVRSVRPPVAPAAAPRSGEPSFAPRSGLVDALLDPEVGRRSAGALQATRPRPRPADGSGVTEGASGPEALIRAAFDAVAADLRGNDVARQFDAVDDLLTNRIPPIRDRFARDRDAHEQARVAAESAITGHDTRIAQLTKDLTAAQAELTTRQEAAAAGTRSREEAEAVLEVARSAHRDAVAGRERAQRAFAAGPAAERQRLAQAAQTALQDAVRAGEQAAAAERRLQRLRREEGFLEDEVAEQQLVIARDTAAQVHERGARELRVQDRDRAIENRGTAGANRTLAAVNLDYLRSLAADWAGLELGDARRTAARVEADQARPSFDAAAAEVAALLARPVSELTPDEVGRLAYLAHLDGVRAAAETAHQAGLPALRARLQQHLTRMAGYTGSPIAAPELTRLVDGAVTLHLWTALSDAFDGARGAAEQARTDAADSARVRLDRPNPDLGALVDSFSDPATRQARLPQTGGHVAGLGPRIELVRAPSAPWFLREKHVLGDGYVRKVNDPAQVNGIATFSAALTGDAATVLGTSKMPGRSVRGKVETWLTKQLVSQDVRHWEKLIESGVGRDFNGRFVRLHVRPANPVYQNLPQPGLKAGDSNMHIKGGDVSYSRAVGGGTGWGLPFFAAVFVGTANEVVRFAIGPIARFFAGGSRRWSESAGGGVQAENMIFTGDFATYQFGADAEVVLEIDGQEAASRPLNDHLVLAMPQILSSARDEVDPASVGVPTRVTNPAALNKQDFALSAAAFEDPLQELQEQLRQHPDFRLSAKHAARVVDKLRREMMNPQGAKDAGAWWTTNSWLSPNVSMKVGKWRRLEGHLRSGGQLVDLRRITDTKGLVRNDMASVATRGAGRGGGSVAGRRLGAEPPVLVGEHLVLPRWDVAFLNTSRRVNRSINVEASARTMPTRKTELIRYLATVSAGLTFDSSRGQLDVRRNTTVEIAVPAAYADAFEEQVMATPALREVFARPDDPVVTMPKAGRSARPFPRKGAASPGDLRTIADRHRIEVSFAGAVNPGGRWAWADAHPNVTIRDLDATDHEYADVDSVPVFRYLVDATNPELIDGATVFTRGTVHVPGETPRPGIVSAEFVRNPARPVTSRATAATPASPAVATPPPFRSSGVRNVTDLMLNARIHPIELAVTGRSGEDTPARIEDLPASLHALWPVRNRILLRGDGDYTYPATAPMEARYRYLIDDRGTVTAAIPLGDPAGTGAQRTRTAGDPQPNPALYRPARPAGPVTPEQALAAVRSYLDGLTSYTQVQLTAGVPAEVEAALRAEPLVELLDRTGARVPGQTPPATAAPAATRSTVRPDGALSVGLPPLTGPSREPWALASRAGLGPGTMKEMPGAELIFADLLLLVEQQMRAVGRKLKGEERQERFYELAAKFGVPGMRGSQRPLFDGGVSDSFTIGKYTFHVNLTGALGDLLDIDTVPDYWIDNRVIGKSGAAMSERLTRRWGTRLDISARLAIQDFFGMQVRFADLQYAWDRSQARNTGQSTAGGRRRKVGGIVTEFLYGASYQLNVSVTDEDGKLVRPASSRAYGGEGFEAPVHVAAEDLAPVPTPQPAGHGITPVTPPLPTGPPPLLTDDEAVDRLSVAEADDLRRWLAGEDVTGGDGQLVSGVRDGIDGMYVWLNRVGKLAERAQRFIDVVDGRLTSPDKGSLGELLQDIAPGGNRVTFEAGVATGVTADFLEPLAAELMSRTGAVVPLDRRGNEIRQLRIHLVPAHARYSHPTDEPQTKEYAAGAVSAGASTTKGQRVRGRVGPSLFVQTGKGAAGLDFADRDVPTSTRLADHVNVNLLSAAMSRRKGASEAIILGGREGTRASYEGRSFIHSSDALFLITYERYVDGVLWASDVDMKIRSGVETSTPYVLAADLGLPVPAADVPVVPPETRDVQPIHSEIAYATSHVEKLTASVTTRERRTGTALRDDEPIRVTKDVPVHKDVLQVVLDNLTELEVDVRDPTISGAVATLFRDSALKRNYRTIRKEGVTQVITLNHSSGAVRRVGVRIVAADDDLTYERPRPDVKTTIFGAGTTVDSRTDSVDTAMVAGSGVDGRFLGETARLAFGASAGYERDSEQAVTQSLASARKRRGGPLELGSQQFGADTRFTLEFFESSAAPQFLRSVVDAASWAGKVADTLADGRLRKPALDAAHLTVNVIDTVTDGKLRKHLPSLFPSLKTPVRNAAVNARLSLVAPSHLTRIGPPRPLDGADPLPERLSDLPPATVKLFDGRGGVPADLAESVTKTEAIAPHLHGLETYSFDSFINWLPATRLAGAERLDTEAPPPRIADYGPMSTVAAEMSAALGGANAATHIEELLRGRYVVKGDGSDEFTVRAVLGKGRWLTRGGYDASNAWLHAEEQENEQGKASGFALTPFDFGAGPASGSDRMFSGTGLGVAKEGGAGGTSAVGGFAIDIERRKGDQDYIWFDVTLIGTSRNGRSWIRSEVPYGLLARIPSARAAEVFAPRPGTLGVVDQALLTSLSDDVVVAYPDRRFLVEQLAKQRNTPPPNLLKPLDLHTATRRALDWTAAVELPPRVAGTPAPTPEDCVERAFGLFVAVHRRTTNVTTDTRVAEQRTADDLARTLGGEFVRLRDPDTLQEYLRNRPGAMVAVRTPAPSGGMSHLFWVMSVGDRRLRIFDGQENGVSRTDAHLGTRRQALTDGLTTAHQRLFFHAGAEAMLLDERGRSVDLRTAVPGAVTTRQSGDRIGRRESGNLPSRSLSTAPVAELRAVLDAGDLARAKQPPPPVAPVEEPGRDRPIRTLGDFSSPAARSALARINAAARASAGGPVVAVSLYGTAATDAIHRLDEMLRHDGWRGELPVVAATLGTGPATKAFREVRLARRVVTVQQDMAGFEAVWKLLPPGADNAQRLAESPDVPFRQAAEIPAEPVATLTRVLADWIAHPDWAAAEAFQRAHDPELRSGTVVEELRGVVASHPGDLRLRAFQTALTAAVRAGGFPADDAPRLTPVAASFLSVEPAYDAAARGPMPATFVYDYLRSAGAARRDRYRLDGLLFQLMTAGQLTREETTSLARAASTNRLDGANARLFELLADLLRTPDAELLADSAAITGRFVALVRPLAVRQFGAVPENCLDPVDRTAWVGRLDAYRDRLRAHGGAAEGLRAEILEAMTYTLSNC
ncbi:hypothetical protein ACIA8K_04015 [Catenuloplanes sp. NPDC051500]|uniref:hypothetical protein n=1 Tax=Catenuloplanes sp. NPDC051500 TaxID=3363959 RepID=UPI0037ABEBBF